MKKIILTVFVLVCGSAEAEDGRVSGIGTPIETLRDLPPGTGVGVQIYRTETDIPPASTSHIVPDTLQGYMVTNPYGMTKDEFGKFIEDHIRAGMGKDKVQDLPVYCTACVITIPAK